MPQPASVTGRMSPSSRAPTVRPKQPHAPGEAHMSSYQASPQYRAQSTKRESGAGAFITVVALLLGIAVGVLSIVAVALVKAADDARDDARAAAGTTDQS